VSYERDVQAFNDRAAGYEAGRLGQLHRDFADRAIRVALAVDPAPARVLDVGSGTGYALRQLAAALPDATELTGVDAAPEMVRVANEANEAAGPGGTDALGGVIGLGGADGAGGVIGPGGDRRVRFIQGTAERLPLPDASVDLVISTTSFDHWADQRAGLAECARVLAPGGHLVLSDLFSVWLAPTLLGRRRGKARTRRRATALITEVGLRSPRWTRLAGPIVATVTAVKG
jgi:ubiquinone/menaquinone biosynthesis C-methylase UbiE